MAEEQKDAAPAVENDGTRLYVSNLVWALKDDGLKELFEEHGAVAEARIVSDRRTGYSRGYGFVTFENAEGAAKALEALNGKDIEGREIRVEIAKSTGPTEPKDDGEKPRRRRNRNRNRNRNRAAADADGDAPADGAEAAPAADAADAAE